ncbi:MAG: hypothetical protein ACI4S4_00245 [Candidatus Ornithospirochaeta sp.]
MAEKKINKWVFMLIATILNLVLVLGLFVLLMVISSFICTSLALPETVVIYVPFLVIILSFILSFVIYNKVMKWAVKKWDLESAFNNRK